MHILQNNAMLVSLTVTMAAATKHDRKISSEVSTMKGAADDACRVSKVLLAKTALADIQKIVSEARQFHYANTLPWDDTGWRILPSANFTVWQDTMRDLKQRFEQTVSRFMTDYPSYVTDARTRLNGMFNADDFPAAQDMATKFQYATETQPIPDGSHFVLDLSQQALDTMSAQVDSRVEQATSAAVQDLWQRLYDGVSHMAGKLNQYGTDPDTGKVVGKFHDSLIGNVRELCDLLPRLNVTNDPDLEAMGQAIESQLTATTPQDLRDSETIRKSVAAKAESIMDSMSGYMS